MLLDVTTLFIVLIFVTTILGSFLLFAWAQDRSLRALAWWGIAYLIGGVGVAIYTMQDSLSAALTSAVGIALLLVACGVIWNGARLFQGRPVMAFWMVAGALVWFFALTVLNFADSIPALIILGSVTIASYTLLTAYEFWRGRNEPLFSRWPAVAVLALHCVVFLSPIVVIAVFPSDRVSLSDGWFGLFALETLLYAIATAFIILTMAKERSERVHKNAAMVDPLTEVFNRRALLDAGRRVLQRMAFDCQAVSVLMFDLDRFKQINDRFGHAVGDRTLQLFARTAAANLRATDVVGRLGGEEFAAILPGTDLSSAMIAAERVRAAFEAAAVEIDGLPVQGSVSIGAATATEAGCEIETLIANADCALYAAKASGRNRVVLSGSADERAAVRVGEGMEGAFGGFSLADAALAPNDLIQAIAAARALIKRAA